MIKKKDLKLPNSAVFSQILTEWIDFELILKSRSVSYIKKYTVILNTFMFLLPTIAHDHYYYY